MNEEYKEWVEAKARREKAKSLNHINGLALKAQRLINEIKDLQEILPLLIRSRRSSIHTVGRKGSQRWVSGNPSRTKKLKMHIKNKMISLGCKGKRLEEVTNKIKELKKHVA